MGVLFSWPRLQELVNSAWHLQATSSRCYKTRLWKTMNWGGGEGDCVWACPVNLGNGRTCLGKSGTLSPTLNLGARIGPYKPNNVYARNSCPDTALL